MSLCGGIVRRDREHIHKFCMPGYLAGFHTLTGVQSLVVPLVAVSCQVQTCAYSSFLAAGMIKPL